MVEKLVERKERELNAVKGKHDGPVKVSDKELFAQLGSRVKVMKESHGD